MSTKRTVVRTAAVTAATALLSAGLSLPATAGASVTNAANDSRITQVQTREFTPIEQRYWSEPHLREVLGHPVDTEYTVGELSYQQFQHGWIYYTPSTGAHETHGAIAGKFTEIGAGANPNIGVPTTDEISLPGGAFNHFTGTDASGTASIYWTPATGAQGIWAQIREFWMNTGWERGYLAYPTSTTAYTPGETGLYNHFQGADGHGASVYWSEATGAHSVQGTIRQHWASLGWEQSYLGFPTSNEYNIPGGKRSDFQGGYIVWDAATNTAEDFPY